MKRALLFSLALGFACATAAPGHDEPLPYNCISKETQDELKQVRAYEDIVAAPDRLPSDVALDAGRKPVAYLEFLNVHPGMTVAELGAGGGYTAELLARVVGSTGTV